MKATNFKQYEKIQNETLEALQRSNRSSAAFIETINNMIKGSVKKC